jgi:hypothetical protein
MLRETSLRRDARKAARTDKCALRQGDEGLSVMAKEDGPPTLQLLAENDNPEIECEGSGILLPQEGVAV